jgi:thioredoxin 1
MRLEQLPNVIFVAIALAVGAYALRNGFDGPPVDPGLPSDASFAAVINGPTEYTLVKFGADWCGPCRAVEHELDVLSGKMHGRVTVVKVDIDQHRDLARHYGVSGIPKLVLFRQGHLVDELVGSRDAHTLEQWVSQAR